MGLSAAQAAVEVGLSKAGIIKAIRTGKISAEKDALGQWQIQPVELYRVYSPVNGNGQGTVPSRSHEVDESQRQDIDRLQVELDGLRQQVTLLAVSIRDKEAVINAKDDLIDVLRGENTRLTAVITQLSPTHSKKGWWARLLGGA